jgi:GNAT superfamily N-acetyltransferase
MESPIRTAGTADLPLLGALMRDFYAESGYPLDAALGAAALGELLGDRQLGRVWLILEAEEPVGYLAVTFGFSLEYHGRDGSVDELFVRPARRGRGLATRALAAVERECRKLGLRALHLEVERENPAGQALYRRRGFADNDRQLLSKRLRPRGAGGAT